MTDKNTYWVRSEDTYALVSGAAERDRYVGLGWVAADEPEDGWVHMWRDGIEQPGRVPVAALRDLWAPAGWVAGPPPDGMHPLAPESPAEAPAESKPEAKPAAGGNAKEK